VWIVCDVLLVAYAMAVRWWIGTVRVRWQRPPGLLPIDVIEGWVALPGRCVCVLPLVPFCFAGSTLMAFCASNAHGLVLDTCNVLFLAFNAALLLSVLLCLLVHALNWPTALIPPDRRGGPGFQVAVSRQQRAGRFRYSTSPWEQKDGTRDAPGPEYGDFRRWVGPDRSKPSDGDSLQ